MYLKAGRPHLLYGTQGADGQPQALAAVLTRLIDYEMDPHTALGRPRFLLGKTFSDSRDSLKLKQDAGAPVFGELAARGHQLSPIPARKASWLDTPAPSASMPKGLRVHTILAVTGEP